MRSHPGISWFYKMENILELEHINKIYGTGVKTQVLSDINASFRKGSFNAIIGQSGSGKSTLLNIMGTLDTPTSGIVKIDGISTQGMSPAKLSQLRNKKIGFVFQFHYLLPEFTAIENVLMPYRIGGGRVNAEIRGKAKELMELVKLENKTDMAVPECR